MNIPLTQILPKPLVEESWSKDLPADTGANAVIEPEFKRDEGTMEAAIKQTQKLRDERLSMLKPAKPNLTLGGTLANPVRQESGIYYFFIVNEKAKSLKFMGKREFDMTRFQKDVSGRLFRSFLKQNFPKCKDLDDIIALDGAAAISELEAYFE